MVDVDEAIWERIAAQLLKESERVMMKQGPNRDSHTGISAEHDQVNYFCTTFNVTWKCLIRSPSISTSYHEWSRKWRYGAENPKKNCMGHGNPANMKFEI